MESERCGSWLNSQSARGAPPLGKATAASKTTLDEDLAKAQAKYSDDRLAKFEKAMEEKFARENERLKAELSRSSGGAQSAAQAATLKQMDSRKLAIESYKQRAQIHLAEYKRELIRLEDALQKVTPLVAEANNLASHLGRGVSFEAALITTIPQSMALSPVEELLTQKVTELLVRVVLHNPRTNERREWLWSAEHFFMRVGHMRTMWQAQKQRADNGSS